MAYYVGIDGCKAGWFAVTLVDHMTWKVDVFDNIEHVWKVLSNAKSLLIDIPIGLCAGGEKKGVKSSFDSCQYQKPFQLTLQNISPFDLICHILLVYCLQKTVESFHQ